MIILKGLFAIFAVIAVADKITGNHLKLGQEFDKGIQSLGTLALSMVGMICIAPTISNMIVPILKPVATAFQMDPSFIGGFIANDMGGAAISQALAENELVGGFHGWIVASMLGVTICFTVPVSLKMISQEHHKDVLKGILCGIVTLPIGCWISGIMLKIRMIELLHNLFPVLFMAVIICIGLKMFPDLCCKCFLKIGNIISVVIMIGLVVGIFSYLTGIEVLPSLMPVDEAFGVICDIAIMLSGVFPFVAILSKWFRKMFGLAGEKIGINDRAMLGLITSLANSIPTFDMMNQMDTKGRMMNMAFAVSASFVLGDHLAFTLAFAEQFVLEMIVGKFVSGIMALLLCHFVYESGKNE